ncbi:hypothetical protein TPDSL_08910 [Terrisporobacter petrolearius]|uniref:SH3 domain-containing protein n=1 Tax=Terrisporobacter petrolearius TaxID=1460447 RepID=UPI0008E2878B|nr:Uncharacterized conserved protein YgiM, contains N-terminal SH3 domain, DUF1202 family [Terrisporobacter glycolicus]
MKYNVLKKFMVTGLASMLCLGGVSMADLSNYNTNTVTNVYAATIKDNIYSATGTINNNVSMRKGPGTSYTRLDTLKKGTKVTIVAKSSNNWYKIKNNKGYAYVYSQYVTIKSNSDKKEDVAYSATGISKSAVYVRKSASTNSAKLGTLNKNTKVTIVAKSSNNWYKIKFNNGYGYVCGQYLNITNNSDNKEDKYPQSGVVNHAVYARKGTSTNYAKLGILKKNTKVTILSKTTYGWYKIQYKNGIGYVYSQYIDVNSTQK